MMKLKRKINLIKGLKKQKKWWLNWKKSITNWDWNMKLKTNQNSTKILRKKIKNQNNNDWIWYINKKRHRNTSNETIESSVWPPKDVTHAAQRAWPSSHVLAHALHAPITFYFFNNIYIIKIPNCFSCNMIIIIKK